MRLIVRLVQLDCRGDGSLFVRDDEEVVSVKLLDVDREACNGGCMIAVFTKETS